MLIQMPVDNVLPLAALYPLPIAIAVWNNYCNLLQSDLGVSFYSESERNINH